MPSVLCLCGCDILEIVIIIIRAAWQDLISNDTWVKVNPFKSGMQSIRYLCCQAIPMKSTYILCERRPKQYATIPILKSG